MHPFPLLALLLALAMPSLLDAKDMAPRDDAKILAAFSLLAPTSTGQTVAIGRVVVDGADSGCPRLGAGPGAADIPMHARDNPDPRHFPVTVCEAVIAGRGPAVVRGSALRIHGVPAKAERVVVIGDSGCEPTAQHGCQRSPDARAWPLHAIARRAAMSAPDLVLHMGDYNYRGTPGKIRIDGRPVRVYDAGDNVDSTDCQLAGPYVGQNSPGSDAPDRWENWRADLFEPAADLLGAAPWVVARGNHELCSRAGPGWFYLLDPGSALPGVGTGERHCPPATAAEPLLFDEPYRIDIPRLSLVVLDSANACDQGDLHQAHFDRQFATMQSLANAAPSGQALWLQSHRPLWAVRARDGGGTPTGREASDRYASIDQTLQTAWRRHPPSRPLDLVLSGHMHRFQVISFAGATDKGDRAARPTQLVVGNSGVDLARNVPEHAFSLPVDGATGTGFGLSAFGYMVLRPGPDGAWSGRLVDPAGRLLARCDSRHPARRTGICRPADRL